MKHVSSWVGLFAFAACTHTGEKGSGNIKTDLRTVPPFQAVEISNGLEADVAIGALGPVEVRGDDNLLPRIVTEVSDGKLRIRVNGEGFVAAKIHIHATTPELNHLRASSGSTLEAKGLRGAKLGIETSSGASLTASGSVRTLDLKASSGSKADAGGLSAEEVDAQLSSGARATVTATAAISGSTSSGSNLRVKGNPPKRSVTESSGGSVEY